MLHLRVVDCTAAAAENIEQAYRAETEGAEL